MDWLLARPTIIGLAATGGALSILAMALRARPGRESLAKRADMGGYVFMGISMLLFIIVGFRGAGPQ